MNDSKTSHGNPFHKEFGTLNNTFFVLGRTKKYCPSVIPLGMICMIFGSAQGYFWGVLSKVIIDIIASAAPTEEKLRRLVVIILIVLPAAFVIYGTNTFVGSKLWPRRIRVRMGVIREREEKAMRMDYERLEDPYALDLHQRAGKAAEGHYDGVEGMLHTMQYIGTDLVTALTAFAAVTVLDWRLILVLTALTLLSFSFYKRTVKKDKTEVQDRLAPVSRRIEYMSRVTQHFDYAKDIRMFSMRDFLLAKQKRVYAEREERMDAHYDMWRGYELFGQVMNVIGRALVYAVLFFAVTDEITPMTIGNFTLYLSFAMAFSSSLLALLRRVGDYGRFSMQIDDLRSFLEMEDDVPTDALPVPITNGYEIVFHNVSYKYPHSERYALRNLNMTLHEGERLAVVGLNGAGKTTMIKLLLRLYDPTEGCITLGGIDIRRFRRDEYYRLFSSVFQKTELFAASLAENISMMPDETTDSEKAERCMDMAGLADKLSSLERGFDTPILKVVSEDGVDFSGGEKQKLALARALYKDAPIVVLDEPTAALDALAEKQLYERFNGMIGSKSAVYISHRLASTRFCDHIAMFIDGQLCEYGTHDELIEKGGEYAEMFEVQAQYYREDTDEEGNA